MNKNAQSMGLAILSFLGIIIVGFIFINFLLPEVSTFRIGLSCADADNISSGNKVLCLIGDATIPYVILIVLGLAIGAITQRLNI